MILLAWELPEGMIKFPGVGPINAFEKGTSFIDLKNHLKKRSVSI